MNFISIIFNIFNNDLISSLLVVFISLSTNVANLQPNILSNELSAISFKTYAAFALKIF